MYLLPFLMVVIIEVLIGITAVFIIDVLIKKQSKSKMVNDSAIVLFFIYLGALIWVTVLMRSQLSERLINFIPFKEIIYIFKQRTYEKFDMIIMNIIMLIPFGVLFPMVFKKVKLHTIFCGVILIVAIELLQYITRRGVFDISDIIYNTLGVIIGYAINQLIMKHIDKRKNLHTEQ